MPKGYPQSTSLTDATELKQNATFNSVVIPKLWLQDLKKISALVEQKRRLHNTTTRVRIAILDTGLDAQFAGFQNNSTLLDRVMDMADFTEHSATEPMTDTFGHGTFMARLIMECAPGAEIVVARVAKSTRNLEGSQSAVSKIHSECGWKR